MGFVNSPFLKGRAGDLKTVLDKKLKVALPHIDKLNSFWEEQV